MINATTSFLYAAWNDQCLNSYIFMGQQWIMNGLLKYWITYRAPFAGPQRHWASTGSLWFCEGGESEERKRLQWPASYSMVALLGGAGGHWSHAKGTHSMSNSTYILFKNIVQRQLVPSIAIYVHFLSRIMTLYVNITWWVILLFPPAINTTSYDYSTLWFVWFYNVSYSQKNRMNIIYHMQVYNNIFLKNLNVLQ